eukprot:g63555.t1
MAPTVRHCRFFKLVDTGVVWFASGKSVLEQLYTKTLQLDEQHKRFQRDRTAATSSRTELFSCSNVTEPFLLTLLCCKGAGHFGLHCAHRQKDWLGRVVSGQRVTQPRM